MKKIKINLQGKLQQEEAQFMKEKYSSNVERKSFYSRFVFKNYFESCLKVKLPWSTEYGLKEHSNVSGQPFP